MKHIFILLLLVFSRSLFAEVWMPAPKFNIEGANNEMTLTFISGVAYALTRSSVELINQGKVNFVCNAPTTIGSKLLIDILNQKHDSSITSEQAINTIVIGLKERYPCK